MQLDFMEIAELLRNLYLVRVDWSWLDLLTFGWSWLGQVVFGFDLVAIGV